LSVPPRRKGGGRMLSGMAAGMMGMIGTPEVAHRGDIRMIDMVEEGGMGMVSTSSRGTVMVNRMAIRMVRVDRTDMARTVKVRVNSKVPLRDQEEVRPLDQDLSRTICRLQ
jgi:hypothetical protein